ncbi:MAG: transposase [Syntrophaceae bacterium]|nr:transposase [Syntrophaceae bacterium]
MARSRTPRRWGIFCGASTWGISGSSSVLAECFRRVYRAEPKRPSLTVDIDSTLDEGVRPPKGARMAYTGIRALNPLMGFIRETGDWLHGRLRAGNVHTADGAVSFIGECVHKVKDLAERIDVAMDSGFYDKSVVAECERLGVGFTITADQTAPLSVGHRAVPEEAWAPLPGKPEVWVSETLYRPTRWPRAYRMLLRRERLPRASSRRCWRPSGTGITPSSPTGREAATELVPEHLQRATAENFIRETRVRAVAGSVPLRGVSRQLGVSDNRHAGLQPGELDQAAGLPGLHKKKLLKRLRYRFFNVAARVVHHGRYRILKFARGFIV